MIIGAILQASSFSYSQLVVARIVTGVGNGLNVGAIHFIYCVLKSLRRFRRLLSLRIMQNVLLLRNEGASSWLRAVS